MDPILPTQGHDPWFALGQWLLAAGSAVLLASLGLVSRKLGEALRTRRYYLLHFAAAALAALAPLGDILVDRGPLDWFTLQLAGAFAMSLVPTWAHWHWLFLGGDH